MKLAFIIISVLTVTSSALFGQDPPPDCPKLEVIGPRGIISPNEPATFVLQMDRDHPERYSYRWTVENGSVTNGQGTRVVEVTTTEYGTNVRATVAVSGLPGGCDGTASEVAGVVQKLEWEPIDEWGELPNDDQRGRLDLFFSELANNPHQNGLVIIGTKGRNWKSIQKRRLRLILDHTRFRNFDKGRLVFCLLGPSYANYTRIYRFRPESESDIPYPECELVSGRDLK